MTVCVFLATLHPFTEVLLEVTSTELESRLRKAKETDKVVRRTTYEPLLILKFSYL